MIVSKENPDVWSLEARNNFLKQMLLIKNATFDPLCSNSDTVLLKEYLVKSGFSYKIVAQNFMIDVWVFGHGHEGKTIATKTRLEDKIFILAACKCIWRKHWKEREGIETK